SGFPIGHWPRARRRHRFTASSMPGREQGQIETCGRPLARESNCVEGTMSQLELRPGLADVPVAESAVSFIDGRRARLEYRGIAVETLARDSCFEETAWLLLKGELPSQRELANFDD